MKKWLRTFLAVGAIPTALALGYAAIPASAQEGEGVPDVLDAGDQTARGDGYAGTRVVMLGTGSPVPNPTRSAPAVAVVVGEDSYLFDVGPGIVRQAAKMSPRFGGPIWALQGRNLKTAFITHLHSDHTAGLADLLLTGWSGGHRAAPLELYGPEGVETLAEHLYEAYEDDIKYRIYGLEITNNTGWRINAHTVTHGVVYKDENVEVTAFPVQHGTWPNAFGYRITTPDKTIVISGDLAPGGTIREYSRDTDILVHEVYCKAGLDRWVDERILYHRANHTSTEELVDLANEVKPGLLVLTHVLWFGCSREQLMAEMAGYEGEMVLAEDFDVYK